MSGVVAVSSCESSAMIQQSAHAKIPANLSSTLNSSALVTDMIFCSAFFSRVAWPIYFQHKAYFRRAFVVNWAEAGGARKNLSARERVW